MIWAVLRHWRLIALAAALAGAFWAGWAWQGAIAAQKASALVAAAQAAELSQTKRMMQNAEQAAREYEAGRAVVAADLAVATGQLDRLRADLARIGTDSSAPSSPDAARIAGILGECAGEVVRLAGEADGLAAKVTGLQAWARLVAPPE